MNFSALDSRNRRNLLAHSMNAFSPPFLRNYSTDRTVEMKTPYGDSLFINTVHLIPEPMKTNLADSVVTLDEKKIKTNMAAETKGFVNNNHNMKSPPENQSSAYQYPSLAGIASFFAGVFNVMGGIFQKRANSPVQYYDCFEQGYEDHREMAPSSPAWQRAKHEDQNKNGRAEADEFADESAEFEPDMSQDYRSIAAQCEDKLNQVRLLLTSNTVHRTRTNNVRPRRPKRSFHEAGSVEELFEDAFTPEDFISSANETFLEYCSPFNLHHEEKCEVEAPKMKTEQKPVEESTAIVQTLPSSNGESKSTDNDDGECKRQVVTSCEDKVSQLKALLQNRRQKNMTKLDISTNIDNKTAAIPIPSTDTNNETEVIFAKEIDIPNTPSPNCLDPSSYFDEVTGRFFSSSATDSEDSFQIVFSDSPRNSRKRIPSDCESEDSFIVFEDNPENCYTTNDVFGDELLSDSDDSDCESDFDSGVNTITLSHSLSRTFGDLTDGSLYESRSEDVVDCAFRSGSEVPEELIDDRSVTSKVQPSGDRKRGLLLDETKKRERRNQPAKKVHFSSQPPRVHVMRVWAFAARQARAGPWERHALDRERFRRRIADVDMAVSWVLKPQHRARVMFQRFMPWWNAQKRKELAEQKQRDEERIQREKEEAERLADNTEDERILDPQECADETVDIVNVSNRGFDVNCKVVNAVDSENVELNRVDNGIVDKEPVTLKADPKVVCNGNADVNGDGDLNRVLNDEKIIKDIDLNKGLKNGIKQVTMICYKQQQAL